MSLMAASGSAQQVESRPAQPVLLAAGAKTPKVRIDVKGVERASVMPDTTCPVLVKPYALTDNLGEIASVVGKGALDQAGDMITSVFAGGKASLKTATFLAAAKLTAKRSNWLPMQAEVAIGEQHKPDSDELVERDTKVGAPRYSKADRILKEVLDAVGEPYDYDFKLYVLKNSSSNAAAMAGGFVYVDSGLVDDVRLNRKARFAIAHEIAHVLRRHETQELQSMIVDSITSVTELVGMLKGSKMSANTVLDHVGIEKHRFTQHHIDEELEADSCAIKILDKGLKDPVELRAILQAFIADMPPDTPVPPPLAANASDIDKLAASVTLIVDSPIQRHPNDAQRKANLSAMLDQINAALPAKR